MPAVSTNFQVIPPSSISSSTGSRVVPAISLTTTRSSFATLFSSEDLPTFGRPIRAMRRGPPTAVPKVCAGASGRASRTASSMSPVPRPCSEETGCGSPRPRDHRAVGVGLAARAVDLVGAEHDGLAGPAQQLDDGLVGVGGADRGVHDEDDRVGGLDRVLGLGGDGGVDAEDVLLPAAGVDDLEAAACPLGLVGDAVAGDAGLVLDDGLAAADDAVHQGRLADIRAADDGEDGQRAVAGLLDRALDVLGVEALFRGELHELRVLGVAKLLRAVAGVIWSFMKSVTSFVRRDRWTATAAGRLHYSSLAQRPVRRLAFSRWAVSRSWMRTVASSSALRVRRPLPSPASKASPKTTSTRLRSGGSALINRPRPLGASQHRDRDDRRPAAHGEVREPGAQRGEVALAPGALGEDPEDPAVLQDAERAGDGGAVGGRTVHLELPDRRAGTGRAGRRTPPS